MRTSNSKLGHMRQWSASVAAVVLVGLVSCSSPPLPVSAPADDALGGSDVVQSDVAACAADPTRVDLEGFGWSETGAGFIGDEADQIVVAPDGYFQPDAAACNGLGIVACRRYFGSGAMTYRCWNSDGEVVDHYTPSAWHPEQHMPCSASQLAAWLAAEADDCAREVPRERLPHEVWDLVSPQAMPPTVCANPSLTRFRLESAKGTVRVVYWPLSDQVMQHHSGWTVCATPSQGPVWNKSLPFLECPRYAVGAGPSLELFVGSNCAVKCVFPRGAYDDDPRWTEALPALAAEFTGCASGQP